MKKLFEESRQLNEVQTLGDIIDLIYKLAIYRSQNSGLSEEIYQLEQILKNINDEVKAKINKLTREL